MCRSEKGDSKDFKKFCFQKVRKEYWIGNGAGKNLCDEVKTVRKFTYLSDRVSAGGGRDAAVTVRIRCGWV